MILQHIVYTPPPFHTYHYDPIPSHKIKQDKKQYMQSNSYLQSQKRRSRRGGGTRGLQALEHMIIYPLKVLLNGTLKGSTFFGGVSNDVSLGLLSMNSISQKQFFLAKNLTGGKKENLSLMFSFSCIFHII